MSALVTAARTALLRMLRTPTTILVQLGVPLVLIPILGYSLSGIPGAAEFLKGTTVMSFMAMLVLVMFQLFSGGFMLKFTQDAYFGFRRWRMLMLPCGPSVVIGGTLAAGIGVSLLQGIVLAAYSALAFGARFGGFCAVALALLGLALFAQLLGVLMLLAFRSYGPAFTMTWIVGYGSCALGGMIFPLPTHVPAVRFLTTYGTPASLAQTALLNAARGGPAGTTALCLGALFAAAAVLGLLVFLLAPRRAA